MTTAIFEKIKRRLAELSGLRVNDKDDARLALFISNRERQLGLDSQESYLQWIALDSLGRAKVETALLSESYSSLETYFMRDSGQISLLSNTLLPEIINRCKSKRQIRIWSAACSTGGGGS